MEKNGRFKAKIKNIDLESGGYYIVILNKKFAEDNNIHEHDRIRLKKRGKSLTVVVNHSTKIIRYDEMGAFREVSKALGLKKGERIYFEHIKKPESINHIKKKLAGEELTKTEIDEIVKNIVDNELSSIELAFFVSAVYTKEMTMDEVENLTRSIVKRGDSLKLEKTIIADKHCIGGVPGNRTTMVVVPIVASAGIPIPKTSSRAITSPSGTADTMEVLAPVDIPVTRVKKIIDKINGSISWGGAVNIASADDKLIKIRKPLRLDPTGLLVASIMAKKMAMGATHLLIDIPIGNEAKLESIGEAQHLKRYFEEIGGRLGIKTKVWISDGSKPIGKGVGPALEARDVVAVLQGNGPVDLKEKSIDMAGMILEMTGKTNGKKLAEKLLESGQAWKKMQEIIKEQGGNPNIKPADIKVGKYKYECKAEKSGSVVKVSNTGIAKIARGAGAPVEKGSGVYLNKCVGAKVEKGDVILTIYSEGPWKLNRAVEIYKERKPFEIQKI
ncbi:MAG: AMP phosphorylase [Candidatus Nanoarchaeia archaeon]|nr:AMP phosphorylase [Candidatus Nanoarchaeia archaeon]